MWRKNDAPKISSFQFCSAGRGGGHPPVIGGGGNAAGGQWLAGPFNPARFTAAPLRWRRSVWLGVPQAEIFELMSNHQKWPELFPWVHTVTIDNSTAVVPNGLGARRTCHFGSGMVLEEVIVGWNPPRAYAYAGVEATHPFGMTGHVGVVTCHADDSAGTVLTWSHYFNHPNPAAMQEQLNSSMGAALKNLIHQFSGKIVKEKQRS